MSHSDFLITDEHKSGINILENNQFIFITGGAGVGKSEFCEWICREKLKDKKIAKIAYTGVAADRISGTTIHNFLQLKPYHFKDPQTAWKAITPEIIEKIKSLDCLMIDEISMVDAVEFECIHFIFTNVFQTSDFGSVKIIIVGDLYQIQSPKEDAKMVHNSLIFKKLIKKENTCILTKIFRQDKDLDYANAMNCIRIANIPDNVKKMFNSRLNAPIPRDKVGKELYVFYRNKDVGEKNFHCMSNLKGELCEYMYYTSGSKSDAMELVKRYKFEPLKLKIGARVMLNKNINIEKGLVNGKRGTVIGFSSSKDFLQSGCFQENIIGEPRLRNYPVVFFDGVSSPQLVTQCSFYEENKYTHEIIATVKHLPLTLAFALTIHKVQSLTVDGFMVLDLSNIRDNCYGLCYVALSRVKCLNDLSIVNGIPWKKVCADPTVKEYFDCTINTQKSKISSFFVPKPNSFLSKPKTTTTPSMRMIEELRKRKLEEEKTNTYKKAKI
jgi:ATP-dependent DNA helicase PIF1